MTETCLLLFLCDYHKALKGHQSWWILSRNITYLRRYTHIPRKQVKPEWGVWLLCDPIGQIYRRHHGIDRVGPMVGEMVTQAPTFVKCLNTSKTCITQADVTRLSFHKMLLKKRTDETSTGSIPRLAFWRTTVSSKRRVKEERGAYSTLRMRPSQHIRLHGGVTDQSCGNMDRCSLCH